MTTQCPVLFNSDFVWSIPIYGATVSYVSYDPTTAVMEVVYVNNTMILIGPVGVTATNAISVATDPEQAVLNLVSVSTRTGYPTNYSLPVIQGVPTVGFVLYAQNGLWCYSPISYSYQWLRNGVAIPGATRQFYTLQVADAGTYISVQLTATNQYGTSGPVTSAAIGPIAGLVDRF